MIETASNRRAYSKTVLRIHGMDQAGVRLSIGPPNKTKYALVAQWIEQIRPKDEM